MKYKNLNLKAEQKNEHIRLQIIFMKKILFFLLLSCCAYSTTIAQEIHIDNKISIDTLYYNSEWKVVSSKIIADYYRIKVNSFNEVDKQFRDYFITGELQAKGGYISMDNIDDANTVFNGQCINYYRSGNIHEKRTFIDGKLEGEYTVYYEDGLIKQHVNFKDGKRDGIYTEFDEDGLCIQAQYNNDVLDNVYTVSNSSGCVMKIDVNTNEPIWESPSLEERQIYYEDGVSWPYYSKNGVEVMMSNTMVKDYGKYYKIKIIISNNSLLPIEFDPIISVAATSIDKKDNTESIKVYSSDEYMKKVRTAQNWQAALVGLAEGMAAYNAGYSTSTTRTNTYSSGSAYAYGSGGSASATYSGRSSSVSTTKQYDANAAYQAQVIASNRLANFDQALLSERQIKEEGYFKKTTIYPTETISGYVNIARSNKDVSMSVTVNINGAEYVFNWGSK